MGAIFAVALARVTTWASCPGERVALAADAAEALRGAGADGAAAPLTLLVGAERDGLPAELRGGVRAQSRASRSPRESLNAAMAATVALYEMTRGRDAPRSSRVRAS